MVNQHNYLEFTFIPFGKRNIEGIDNVTNKRRIAWFSTQKIL